VECDPRFEPFDRGAFDVALAALDAADPSAACVASPEELAAAAEAAAALRVVAGALPRAVVHRRRDFAADAMLRALLRNAGVPLPEPPLPAWVAEGLTRGLARAHTEVEAAEGAALPGLVSGLVAGAQQAAQHGVRGKAAVAVFLHAAVRSSAGGALEAARAALDAAAGAARRAVVGARMAAPHACASGDGATAGAGCHGACLPAHALPWLGLSIAAALAAGVGLAAPSVAPHLTDGAVDWLEGVGPSGAAGDVAARANWVVVVLSAGVLAPGSRSLAVVEAVLAARGRDSSKGHAVQAAQAAHGGIPSRRRCPALLLVAHPSWQFRADQNPEVAAASPAVRAFLSGQEAVTFLPPDPAGPSDHEFPSMLRHLLVLLGRSARGP